MVQTGHPLDRVQELLSLFGQPDASVAWLLCDGHPADAIAYTVVETDLTHQELTYGQLRMLSERFAAALAELGIGPGDRVATLMGKSADYLVTLLGIWRLGAVHVPLFTAFAPPAIAFRLLGSAAKVVVCDDTQRSKLSAAEMPVDPPWTVIVAGRSDPKQDLSFADLMARHEPGITAAALGGAAPVVHIYTSGTTGQPKGVVVPTVALAGFQTYAEFALHLTKDDLYWCAADPGWAYGLYFGVLSSLTAGVPSLLLNAPFSAPLTWQVLERFPVTNLAAAPTVYRALRANPDPIPSGLKLRCASSAGEPQTPEVNEWATTALGVPVHDHYGQTEAGMLVNNHHHPDLRAPLRQGSMGHAMPGWTVRVLLDDRDEEAPAGVLGRIAVDTPASPLAWFQGYLNDPAKSREKFTADGRWYLTGDAGRVDEDGYFFFSSRDDDVIIMAGYRIGPFEVESVLLTHPAVAECAVIAVPDDIRGEILEAYIVPRDGHSGSSQLGETLGRHVKTHYAAHAYPRAVHFVPELPKTPSGKIQRFVLRQRRRDELERLRATQPTETR
jgi:acetyl-CoA synthetase